MNRQRMQECIELMQRAKKLDMILWQTTPFGGAADGEHLAKSVEELHSCGNSACFAGYVAVSEQFAAAGGEVGWNGQPVFAEARRDSAIINYLELVNVREIEVMRDIIGAEPSAFVDNMKAEGDISDEPLEKYVGCIWEEWEPEHVIKILQGMLDSDPKLYALYSAEN